MSNTHPIKLLPSAEYLRACFDYSRTTGKLWWKERPLEHFSNAHDQNVWNSRQAGAVISHANAKSGYIDVYLNNRRYRTHRIIWKLVTGKEPPKSIDHENGNPADNRWDNLRVATQNEQQWNRPISKNNTSGYKGVARNRGKWLAMIMIKRTHHHLGRFDTPEQASAAYEAAARKFHGKFYRD